MLLESRKKIREKAHWLEQESFRFQAVTGLVEDEPGMDSGDSELSSGSCAEPTSAFDTWMDELQVNSNGKCAAVMGCGLQDDTEVSQCSTRTQK